MLLNTKKKRSINRYSDADYRSKRLIFVFWICQITIAVSGIQRIFSEQLIDFVIVCLLSFLLVSCSDNDNSSNNLSFNWGGAKIIKRPLKKRWQHKRLQRDPKETTKCSCGDKRDSKKTPK